MTDEDALELWHERAAIREFDGGQSRSQANFNAAKDLRNIYGTIPRCVKNAVKEANQATLDQPQ